MSVYAEWPTGPGGAMKPPPRPGLLCVATRELRWMRHDGSRSC